MMIALIMRIVGTWLLYVMILLIVMIICVAVKIHRDERHYRQFNPDKED